MSANEVQKTKSNRLPAPALFVGPSSRNASNTSLQPPKAQDPSKPARTPLIRQRSLLSPDPKRSPHPNASSPDTFNPSAPFTRRQKQAAANAEAEASSRTEAIWAEMQNTLEEVELSAIKGPGMTVFGEGHSRSLEELRRAQIDLAKAWARSEAEEEGQGHQERESALGTDAADMLAIDRRQKLRLSHDHEEGKDSGGGTGVSERDRLEKETERDIELSRKRREANDTYFEKVNKGVLEVVQKLEEVAKAMKGVELESKEIWRDGESVDTASVTTAPSVT